jgi:hypothetical protein
MTFEFATAGRILFGRGTSQQVPALAGTSAVGPSWSWGAPTADVRR